VNGLVEAGAVQVLERVPVYNVHKDKHGLWISLRVKSVEIRNGEAVVTLSILQATLTVGLILLGVLMVGLVLALCPEVILFGIVIGWITS
jgi:hypothetical protein